MALYFELKLIKSNVYSRVDWCRKELKRVDEPSCRGWWHLCLWGADPPARLQDWLPVCRSTARSVLTNDWQMCWSWKSGMPARRKMTLSMQPYCGGRQLSSSARLVSTGHFCMLSLGHKYDDSRIIFERQFLIICYLGWIVYWASNAHRCWLLEVALDSQGRFGGIIFAGNAGCMASRLLGFDIFFNFWSLFWKTCSTMIPICHLANGFHTLCCFSAHTIRSLVSFHLMRRALVLLLPTKGVIWSQIHLCSSPTMFGCSF